MTNRRQFLFTTGSAFVSLFNLMAGCQTGQPESSRTQALAYLETTLAALEAQSLGQLGVALLDTNTNLSAGHRADERFPMCSTGKFLIAAATLARVDAGQESLSRRVPIKSADILPYAPITKDRVGTDGMTIAEICDAALTLSDNTAANLLLASLGGPASVTAFARSLGDTQTRFDRIEPDLNEAAPNDPRDTTTPAAMLANLHTLALGDALSPTSRQLLIGWLTNCQTGAARLRAGLPANWRTADKTGSGEHGTTNDVAILWPPNRKPLLLCAYLTQSPRSTDEREATLAAVARAIASPEHS